MMDKGATNILIYDYLWTYLLGSFGTEFHLEMEFLGHRVGVYVPLVVTTQLFYKVFKLIYIPISNV